VEKLVKRNLNLIIVVVVCGEERVPEALTMIKSALIFAEANKPMRFVIVTEPELRVNFEDKLNSWKTFRDFSYEMRHQQWPEADREQWQRLFKPCAAQRLFLPSILRDITHILYVDSDILFLSSPHVIFEQFHHFNSSQLAAMSPEAETETISWYKRFARHPFYGNGGLNSGLMFMHLEKMRKVHFEKQQIQIHEQFSKQIVWGDQDILNIYFHYHPDQLHVLNCTYNYRPDYCMYTPQCPAPNGIHVLHGNRGYFHKSEQQPIFSELYEAIEKFPLDGEASCAEIVKTVEYRAKANNASNCNLLWRDFLKIPKTICQD